MSMQKVSIGAILAVAVTGIVVSAFLAASLLWANYPPIHSSGTLNGVGVGVYTNSTCTSNVTSIDWGFLPPGATANRTVYIRNEGNTREMLNMTTANWSAGAYGNITLSWNREGYLLDPAVVVQAVFTLFVSPSISGVTSFSFDITITGTEHA